MNKKISILYASFGGGHKSTANSLKDYLNKYYPDCEVNILDYFEYFNKFINNFSVNFYENIVKIPTPIYKNLYESTCRDNGFSNMVTHLFKLTGIKLIKYFNLTKPDIVISTHPFATQACAYLKSKNKFDFTLATILTDFEIHKLWYANSENINHFFVSTKKMKDNLIIQNISPDKIHITGIPIKKGFSKKHNKDEIYEYFNLDKELKTLTFFTGGMQGLSGEKTYKLIEKVIDFFKDYNIIIINGNNEKSRKKIKNIIKSKLDEYTSIEEKEKIKNNIHLYNFIKEIPEIMYISDFIISKPGGLTTSESLSAGTPMLIISPIPGQEMANSKHIEENNAGIFLKDDKTIDYIFSKIINDKENKIIEELSKNAKKISHPNATKEILDILLSD